jgi:hypothetical protein
VRAYQRNRKNPSVRRVYGHSPFMDSSSTLDVRVTHSVYVRYVKPAGA